MELLTDLVGEQLVSVIFIWDYIQFDFDGARITAITDPTIVIDALEYRKGDLGYRDRLCDLIGHQVRSVMISEGDRFTVSFRHGAQLCV